MSVIVKNISKEYGAQKAVNDISFEAKKGEVLGFLGPNGAGKTTTMKIISCYIPQTDGSASVCGFDVNDDPMEVRKKIGYLPEHNPLYLEMYVKEYLNFISKVHKVSGAKSRISDLIEMTGLGKEQGKKIAQLSKGYRQRVGLAQAMLHDPEVLILDEPTSGLDPNQLVEIRSLIKQLGKEKTVIFSTHIMQEVQAICDRVVIINNGNLVADDPIERLQERIKGAVVVNIEFLEKVEKAALQKISGVASIRKGNKNQWQLTAKNNIDIRPEIFKFATDKKLTLIELHKEKSSVEDVFQTLTKGS